MNKSTNKNDLIKWEAIIRECHSIGRISWKWYWLKIILLFGTWLYLAEISIWDFQYRFRKLTFYGFEGDFKC